LRFPKPRPPKFREKYRNGATEYYHQLLGAVAIHPDLPQVLPLMPEAILKGDGDSKNDCERNAAKRLLPRLKKKPSRVAGDCRRGCPVRQRAAHRAIEIIALPFHHRCKAGGERLEHSAKNQLLTQHTIPIYIADKQYHAAKYKIPTHSGSSFEKPNAPVQPPARNEPEK